MNEKHTDFSFTARSRAVCTMAVTTFILVAKTSRPASYVNCHRPVHGRSSFRTLRQFFAEWRILLCERTKEEEWKKWFGTKHCVGIWS